MTSTPGPTVTAYGTWPSPITPELLTAEAVILGPPAVASGSICWTEARPSDGGRISLFRRDLSPEATPVELTPNHYVRTRVHEYGGGAWTATAEVVVFSDFPGDGLFRVDLAPGSAGPIAIAPARAGLRWADLRVHPEHDLVLTVREDHRGPGEPVSTIVALSLSGPNDDGGRVLCSGSDFYASPELSADGRLAWVEWDHPNMPWDDTRLKVGTLADTGVENVITLVDGAEAPAGPSWDGDRLIFLTDRSGFWNLYATPADPHATTNEIVRLSADDHDQAGPHWTLGSPDQVVQSDGTILVPRYRDGRMELIIVGTDGRSTPVESDAVSISGLCSDGHRIAMLQGYADRPAAVVIMDPDQPDDVEVIRSAARAPLGAELVSPAESITWDGPQGPVHAWHYPPHHGDHVGEPGTTPPVITLSHGGPTGVSLPTFDATKQFWTTRGFAVLDVNYGGSAGFGRAYRARLAGQWGQVDVADCADAAATLVERGQADPTRLVIMGGSAGGYTTLRALTDTDVFSLGISLYGVGDLGALASDTHKFESRYLDGLVGPWPQAKAVYDDRSPINHVDRLSCPMLILQGTEDKVVPPAQAEQMAAAVRANGQDCELIMFDGEGHGFRRAENIQRTYAASLAFCRRVFGLTG